MKTAAKKTAARRRAAKRTTTSKPGAQRRPAQRSAGARAPAAASMQQLVVDATYVICGAQDRSRLDLLLSLVVAVAADGIDVLCIFDATTPHRLQTSPERDLYRWLLMSKPDHFRSEERRVGKECRSRWSADQ